jgi:hypothetical protein
MDLIDKYLGEKKIDWENFYKMSKDKSGKSFKEYEKKYGAAKFSMPHIEDALKNTKDFKQFMKVIKKFESTNEAMGFVQKLDYQKKKSLTPSDRALLKARGGTGKLTTKRGETNLSKTPSRPEPSKVKKALQKKVEFLVKVGDIFYNSWGYGQTNIDWYQVVSVSPTGKTVKIRPIEQKLKDTGNMTGTTLPYKNKFKGKVIQKKIRVSGKEVNLPFPHGWCPLWDGKEKHSSWYH